MVKALTCPAQQPEHQELVLYFPGMGREFLSGETD